MQIKEIIDLWLAEKQQKVKISSFAIYATNMENHITPFFGQMSEVRSEDVDRFVKMKEEEGCSPNTIASLVTMIKSVLKYGEKKGMTADVAIGSYQLSGKKQEGTNETLSSEQEKKLINYVYNHPTIENIGIALCLQTGLRIGEVCGIKWKDIDSEKPVVNVERTVERIYVNENGHKYSRVIIAGPKSTTSVRSVPFDRALFNRIRVLRPQDASGKYFLTGTEKPTEPRAYRNIFTRLMTKMGSTQTKFGILRNTYAMRNLANGMSYDTLTVLLGISSPSITRMMFKPI